MARTYSRHYLNLLQNKMAITPEMLIEDMSGLITFFEAIGGLIVAYIIFGIVNLILGRKKEKELKKIREAVEEINKKLGKKR